MSDVDDEQDTLPPGAESYQQQLELTTQLYDDPRPEVRLTAHVSQRLLDLGDTFINRMNSLSRKIAKLDEKLDAILEKERVAVSWRREISERVEALELSRQQNGTRP